MRIITGTRSIFKRILAKDNSGAGICHGPAAATVSTSDAGAILWAGGKGKRKRKKKAAPKTKPAVRKKAPARAAPDRKRKPKQVSNNWLERNINDIYSWLDGQGFTWKDYFRMALLAGGLLVVLYYSFSAGGYFVVKRSYGELAILYFIVLGLLFGVRAGGSMSRLGWQELGFIGAYALWILLSVSWSYIPARSLDEFIRVSLYLGGYALFYMYLARREWLTWIGHLFIIIVFIVALDSVFGKIGIIDHPDPFETNRLSYPLTYWNTLGLMMIMAFPVTLRVLADRATHIAVRCLYAPALVLFITVLFFTFSRAGLLLIMLIFGLYLLVAVQRLRAVMQAAIAFFWAAVIVGFCYIFLPTMVRLIPNPDEGEAEQLGIMLLSVLLLAVGSQVIVWFQEQRITISADLARMTGYILAGAVVFLFLAGSGVFFIQKGGPVNWVSDQIEVISEPEAVAERAEERLLSLQSERYKEYEVSLGALADNPMRGSGAGTWSIHWLKERPREIPVKDGHSWLFETMAELGLVGTALMAAFLVTFFVRCIGDLRYLGRSRHREIYGAFFVACTAFIVHAMIDWDWEMAVITLSFFMFAGGLLRYGILSRAAVVTGQEAGAEDEAMSHEPPDEDKGRWSLRRLLSWNLLIGCLCVLMMILTVFPLAAENRILSAKRLAQDGGDADFDAIRNQAATAHRFNPLDGEALVWMAVAAENRGDDAEAERLMLEAIELEPYNDMFYRSLTRIYIRTGNAEGAIYAIKKSRELNPLESRDTGPLEEQLRKLLSTQNS